MRTRRRLLWATAVILLLAGVMSMPAAAQASPAATQAATNCSKVNFELNWRISTDGWLVNSNPLCRVLFFPSHHQVPLSKCLDVQGGSTADRTPIIQYTCGPTLNQAFGLIPVSGTSNTRFTIRARHSGKCFDVSGASTANYTPIVQYQCLGQDGAPHQQWGLRWITGDLFELRARHSGKCADVYGSSTANGAPLIQYTCTGGSNQRFVLVEVQDA